jgi:MFS family permease
MKRNHPSLTNKTFFVAFLIIISILIIDTSAARVFRFTFSYSQTISHEVWVFTFLVATFAFGQYLITRFLRSKIKKLVPKVTSFDVRLTLFSVSCISIALIILLVALVSEIYLTTGYSLLILKAVLYISYGVAIILTTFLAYKFVKWLGTSRSYIVFFYTLAVASMTINLVFTLIYVNGLLAVYGSHIIPHTGSFIPTADPNSIIPYVFQISFVVTYVIMWTATSFLLKSTYSGLARIRYWTIMTLPLVYFLLPFLPIIPEMIISYRLVEPIFSGIIYSLFFSLSQPLGGILFALAFWRAEKKVGNRQLKDFLAFSAYGLILFFITNQAIVLVTAPFPPFGSTAVSFMPLGSYMILVGIYFSALSVSNNMILRRSIKKSLEIEKQLFLLDRIGTSEMEQQVQRKVNILINDFYERLHEQSMVPKTIDHVEMKKYTDEVIEEIKKQKNEK